MKKCMISLTFLVVSLVCLSYSAAFAAPQAARAVVLPFQINADKKLSNLTKDVPALVKSRLEAKGITVVSSKETDRLIRAGNVTMLNEAEARNLARAAGADFAVFGSFTQLGDSFSLDVRTVDSTGSRAARPYFVQRDGMANLLPAVDDLAIKISSDVVSRGGIADIQIRGLKVLDADVVLMRLNVRKGDTIDAGGINEEVRRVWDTGYFSDVQVNVEQTGEGAVLVFTVQEKPRIDDVIIKGSDAVKKDDILAAMSSKTGSVMNEKLLAQDIQKVTDLYRKEGFYLAEVTAKVEERSGGASGALVFDVKEGEKLYIKKVAIEGANQLKESDIKEGLALTERGLLSWFTGTGVLREEHLERDSAAVGAYYLNHGYVDAVVASPRVEYEADGIVITFPVNEGERYSLGEIKFAGDLIDTDETLFNVIALDEHKTSEGYFSLEVMQKDIKKLTEYYGTYGYAFAVIDVETQKQPEGHVLDLTYTALKKEKIYVRRVTVEGNTRTRDNVIMREMRLADGDEFNAEKLRRSNERLSRLGYFTKSDILVEPTDNPDEVDLRVKVEDDRTGAIMGGVGYSTATQFGVSASINERNLFGRGYTLGLSGFISGSSSILDLNFVNPRIYDTNLGLANNTYATWNEWDDFDKRTVGNTFSFFYPLGEYTTVGAGYRIDRYRLSNFSDDAPSSYRDYEGNNLSSVLHSRLVFDSTNSREKPTRGYINRTFLEYGGSFLGGNDDFIRTETEFHGFHRLFTDDHVFHWRGKVGGVFENGGGKVAVFNRYFIGGIDTIRGYSQSDLSPRDKNSDDQIGGDRIGFVNLEYIWTFHNDLGLSLVPFFDAGFQTDSNESSDPFSKIKKSVGTEFRWRSPMGDMRFAYGFPLDKTVEGKRRNSGRFEFTIGQFF